MPSEKTALLSKETIMAREPKHGDHIATMESAIDDSTAEGDLRKLEMQHLIQTKDSWTWYRLTCQFRFAYMSFLVLMVIIMFSFSSLMEVFFSVFLPSAQVAPGFVIRCIVFLGLLPFLIILLSYIFEESCRLFLDSLDSSEGSLPNFRLSVAVVIHYIRHFKEMPEDDVGRAITYDPYKDDKPESNIIRTPEEEERAALANAVHHEMSARHRWQLAIRKVIQRNRAAIVFGTTTYEGPPIDYSTFVVVDLICPVLFEITTLFGFFSELYATQSINEAFYRYLRVGFFTMGFYLFLWMVCHWWSSRNSRMRELVANYHRTRRALEKKIAIIVNEETFKSFWLLDLGFRVTHTVKRGVESFVKPAWCCCIPSCSSAQEFDVSMYPREPSAFEKWQNEHTQNLLNPWTRLSLNMRLLVLLPAVILSAYLSLLSFYVGWPLMGFFLIVGASTIQRRFPQIFGDAFRHFVTAFILVSFIFFASSFVVGTFVTGGNFKVLPPHEGQVLQTPRVETWGQIPRYAVCNLNQSGLNIVDFILIADAAYGRNTSLQEQMLHERFDGTALQNWNFSDWSDPVKDHQKWFQVDFLDLKVSVVAIRGTASAADALEDMHYWFGITIMQAANVFVPFLSQLPQDFVVQLLSMNLLEKVTPPPVYTNLVAKVRALRDAGNRVVLTGHSLGGAMAAMVGAKTRTPAISFSGPGLVYTRGRFHLEEADIRDYVMTIKPVNDIVPRVDVLGGMVQETECRKKNPLACHGSSTHACELYMTCGDKRGRDWSQAAQYFMSLYNKVENQGALMGNWVEEEALRHDTGHSRYQTWSPKDGMGRTHPRVIAHADLTNPKDYKATSKANNFNDLIPSNNNLGPRERRRMEELTAQAKAIKDSMENNAKDVDDTKETEARASFKAYDPGYLAHGIVRVPPRGRGGFKDYDPATVGKTRAEIAANDAALLEHHQVTLPQQETVTRYSHAVTSGVELGFPMTAAAEIRNPFGRSSGFTNDIMDAKKCHAEASYPGAETIVGIGMNIQTRAAVLKIKEWVSSPQHRRDLLGLCDDSTISLQKFSFGLHEIGLGLPDRDIQQIFLYLDKEQIGQITWKSFLTLLD